MYLLLFYFFVSILFLLLSIISFSRCKDTKFLQYYSISFISASSVGSWQFQLLTICKQFIGTFLCYFDCKDTHFLLNGKIQLNASMRYCNPRKHHLPVPVP